MKKLMIAAAAALGATVGLAESSLTSANVVGYGNISLRSGSKMIGLAFENVNGATDDAKKIDLTSLKVTGYESLTDIFGNEDDEGVDGQFTITILSYNGDTEKEGGVPKFYRYYHDWADGDWDGEPYWKHNGKVVTEGQVTFSASDGLWFEVDSYAYTTEQIDNPDYHIVSSGAALMDARAVELRSGCKGIAVPLSASVDLYKMSVTGYESLTDIFGNDDDEGVDGQFTITILAYNGDTEKEGGVAKFYRYYHDWADGDWDGEPYWKHNGKVVAENEITFPMGTGLWVEADSYAYTTEAEPAPVYRLQFPGLDD